MYSHDPGDVNRTEAPGRLNRRVSDVMADDAMFRIFRRFLVISRIGRFNTGPAGVSGSRIDIHVASYQGHKSRSEQIHSWPHGPGA